MSECGPSYLLLNLRLYIIPFLQIDGCSIFIFPRVPEFRWINWNIEGWLIASVIVMCFCSVFSRTHDEDERTNLLERHNSFSASPSAQSIHNDRVQQRTTADVFNALGIESATREGLRLSELRKRRILMHERIEDVFQSSTGAHETQYLSIGTRECNKATISDNMFVTSKPSNTIARLWVWMG